MARVTVEDCLEKVSNRFILVALVAKRVRQLLQGDETLVQANNKHVVNALREAAAGKIDLAVSYNEMAEKLESLLKFQNGGADSTAPSSDEPSSKDEEPPSASS